jgi:hypothetical protein
LAAEDATTDPAQVKAANEELAVFMKAINEARVASGEPPTAHWRKELRSPCAPTIFTTK